MGFEIVVRPVVFPNIRPAPAQPSPLLDDPTKGIATIKGTGGKFIELPWSWSFNSSNSNPTETKRTFDVARIYQKEDDGNINKDNFVDVEVPYKISMKDGESVSKYNYDRVEEADNVEVTKKGQTRQAGKDPTDWNRVPDPPTSPSRLDTKVSK